jgi:excisionase family DNA binding protein
MPRVTKHPHAFLAMSPDALANAIGVSTRKVRDAILAGALPVYQNGTQRRILISDAEAWVRSWHRKVPDNA